jgi:hypothetical protein
LLHNGYIIAGPGSKAGSFFVLHLMIFENDLILQSKSL